MIPLAQDAKAATEKEHKMTLLQGIRLYPKAIAWSILISTCIAMEGYDLCLLGNFCWFPRSMNNDLLSYIVAFDQFNRKFGEQLSDGTFQISAPWQAGLSNVHPIHL